MSSHFLTKRLSSFSPSSLSHHHLALLSPLLRLSFSTQCRESKEIPFLAKYLISSLGLSPNRALKVSSNKNVAVIKSEQQPASVVQFLKDTGLSDDNIKGLVSCCPRVLSLSVEKSLKPMVRELADGGFSRELLVQFILKNPNAIACKSTLSRLLFWRDFVGNNDQALLTIIRNSGWLISYDIQKHVVPSMNLFKEYGLSNRDIAGILSGAYGNCMSKSLESFKQILEFIEAAGIQRESGMFLSSVRMTVGFKKEAIERKVNFLKMTYGWSKEDVYIHKEPKSYSVRLISS